MQSPEDQARQTIHKMSTDLTFVTNEPGNNLRDRFNALLTNDSRFFDCLVGYFYISGFHKVYPALEQVEKVRILVGLQTDRAVYDAWQHARRDGELNLSHASTKQKVAQDVLDELEKASDAAVIETGVHKFIEWLRSGKVEIKAHPSENLHAKVYIMTFFEGDRDKGRVITGSSNLTQSGLLDNLEFNVELKTRADYEFALAKFNELWAVAVDLRKPYEDTVLNRSPFAHFTPYELYLKFLYEYFRDELNPPAELDDIRLPDGFKRLQYQEEAVLSARKILDEYGGVFLADVVGLGKTYMAALLAQQLDGRSLVVAPPHLLDPDNPGSWRNVFGDFRVPHTDFESIGKLEDLLNRDVTRYKNVFIDESHRFRTEATQSYEMLAQICRGKRVILVSATPLNNTPRDMLSQIKLFQNGKNSTIPNVRNLEAFFARLDGNLKGLDRQRDREQFFATVQANAKATREQILKFLMIRRTRTEIAKYYGDDLREQDLKFPDVANPEPLFYKFNKRENEIFNETIRLIGQISYARYQPLVYYEGRQVEQQLQGQRNLAKFMKILLVKRLESSFRAFRLTVARFIRSYERVITEFQKGHVYISKKHINKVFDLLESDDDEGIERLLETEKAERLDANDFDPNFIKLLRADLRILREIEDIWNGVRRDPKWLSFRDVLKSTKLRSAKLIIFTESKETAEYLYGEITKEVEKDVLLFTGSSDQSIRRQVLSNFDAKAFHPSDEFRILIATEVLSEGVNLHRSNIVFNYDIPWNPTRLIQRVGRVNRVDLFSRIKRLPKKARSTRTVTAEESPSPALVTYFRQGKLDKFFRSEPAKAEAEELDFFQTAKILKPADNCEKRQNIPADFYSLLDKSKGAFESVTGTEHEDAPSGRGGGQNDAYILKRLKAKEIASYHGYTEDDELFIRQVKQLLMDGALPRPTTKKVAEALKKEIDPLKVLGVLRRDISKLFFQATLAQESAYMFKPREVILSSYLVRST